MYLHGYVLYTGYKLRSFELFECISSYSILKGDLSFLDTPVFYIDTFVDADPVR